MLLLGALLAVTQPPQPARVIVRIERAQRITKAEWDKAARRRELVRIEGKRRVKLRLVEFE